MRRPRTAPPAIRYGARNDTLTSCAGRLCNQGLSGAELRGALAGINREHFQPPLSELEVAGIARSAERWIIPPWATSAGRLAFFAGLRHREQAVLRVLVDHARPDGTIDPGPGVRTIAREAGMTTSVVQKALATLEASDRLVWFRGRRGTPSRYAIPDP